MRALLDVNVLIALHDAQHLHHGLAVDWFEANAHAGWASCPLTQNGCLRVMSQPAYPNARALSELLGVLGRSFQSRLHAFWPDDISIADGSLFAAGQLHGHRQLTDSYLLCLAVRHGGRLVSFDARIARSAVHGAKPQHMVSLLA